MKLTSHVRASPGSFQLPATLPASVKRRQMNNNNPPIPRAADASRPVMSPALARVAGYQPVKPQPQPVIRTIRRLPMKAAETGGDWPVLPDVLRTPINEDLPSPLSADSVWPDASAMPMDPVESTVDDLKFNNAMNDLKFNLHLDTKNKIKSNKSSTSSNSPEDINRSKREISPISTLDMSKLSLNSTPRARSTNVPAATPSDLSNPRRLAQVVQAPAAPARQTKRNASDLSSHHHHHEDDAAVVPVDDVSDEVDSGSESDDDYQTTGRRVKARPSWAANNIVYQAHESDDDEMIPPSTSVNNDDSVNTQTVTGPFSTSSSNDTILSSAGSSSNLTGRARRARARTTSVNRVLFGDRVTGDVWSRMRYSTVPSLISTIEESDDNPVADLDNKDAWADIQRRLTSGGKSEMALSLDDISSQDSPKREFAVWLCFVKLQRLWEKLLDDFIRRILNSMQTIIVSIDADGSKSFAETSRNDEEEEDDGMLTPRPNPSQKPFFEAVVAPTPADWDAPRRRSHVVQFPLAPARVIDDISPPEEESSASSDSEDELDGSETRSSTSSEWLGGDGLVDNDSGFDEEHSSTSSNAIPTVTFKDTIPTHGRVPRMRARTASVQRVLFSDSIAYDWNSTKISAAARARTQSVPSLLPIEEDYPSGLSLDDEQGWAAIQARLSAGFAFASPGPIPCGAEANTYPTPLDSPPSAKLEPVGGFDLQMGKATLLSRRRRGSGP